MKKLSERRRGKEELAYEERLVSPRTTRAADYPSLQNGR